MSSSGGIRSLFDVRPEERRIALWMFLYFFLVITSFWILKPLKKTLFIGYYAVPGFDWMGSHFEASQAELLAKVMNMVVAIFAATTFAMLSRKMRREQLTYTFTVFCMLAFLLFTMILREPSGPGVWAFYLFGDLFNTLMVATFFSFLNDSVSSDGAKRLYGLIGFGGVLGGVFGSSAVSFWIASLSISSWLFVATALGVLIVVVARAAAHSLPDRGRSIAPGDDAAPKSGPAAPGPSETQQVEDPSAASNSPFAGLALIFRSRYLLSIVAIVALYEVVSTILDFQFTSSMILFSESDSARNQNIATVYAATNWLSMFVQLFLTSWVMRRFGLGVALMILPFAIAMASAGFVLAPTLLLGGLLSVSDNGFSYSINQSSKEALYVPTTVEEKYQAKAFIDMFMQRFAKAVAVGLSLWVTSRFQGVEGIRSLSLMLIPVLALWSVAAIYAGRRFREFESRAD